MAETVTASRPSGNDESARGFVFALSAYMLWGMLPFFMKAVDHIPAAQVVAHRVVWSVPVAGVVLLLLRRTADIRRAFGSARTLAMAGLTATVITVNWGVYVWAIAAGRAVETALGYYINPLVSIALAAIFLGERLRAMQIVAVSLAALAVLVLTLDAGGLPWVSLVLALSFASYGFLRKTLPVGPSQGFFLEVLILSFPAIAYIVWLQWTGQGNFRLSQSTDIWLLLACGPVTAVPLLFFTFGAKLLRYSTIGIMQYIAPTMIFLIAVFVFKEPFSGIRAVAFVLIWSALIIYTWPIVSALRRVKDGR